MKTKNVLVAAAFLISGLLNVSEGFAQQTQQRFDNVTLNIKLQPIQTITINPAQKDVNLIYDTKDKYDNGVSREYADHIEVFSTGGFTVSVKSGGDFKRTDGVAIDAGDVKIIATNGSGLTGTSAYSTVYLSTTDTELIYSGTGGRDIKYNVQYDNTAGSNDKYIDNYIKLDGTESVYTATVTYTIAAK